MSKTERFNINTGTTRLAAVLHIPVAPATEAKTLIICHGFRGSKDGSGRAAFLADLVADNGFRVLRFDFTPISPLTQQVTELLAVIAFCRKSFGGEIILLGRSMGGSAALACAAQDKKVAGLCLWSTPANLATTFAEALGPYYQQLVHGETISVSDEYGLLELKPEFITDFTKYDLLAAAAEIKIPLLILHGDRDAIVPLSQAQLLYEVARPPKHMEIVAGGDHHFTRQYRQVSLIILAWLKGTFVASGE